MQIEIREVMVVHVSVHERLVAELVGEFHLVEGKSALCELHFLVVDIVESVEWSDADLRFTNIGHSLKVHGVLVENEVNLS